MYRLYHNNTYRCPALIPVYDECCNYYMDRGLHVEGKLFDNVGMVSPVVGDIKMSIRDDDFEGWIVCDGRALSRTTYANLFALIGTRFGPGLDQNGNLITDDDENPTHFNLPDARGRVLGSVGSSPGTSYWCVGNKTGEESHALTISEMPRHTHVVNDPGHAHTQTTVNDDFNNNGTYPNSTYPSYPNYDGSGSVTWTNTINSSTTGISLQLTGGNADQPAGDVNAHNNMQPTLFIGNTFIYSGVKDVRKQLPEDCMITYSAPPCED